MLIKTCGLTRLEDINFAIDCGVNFLGFVMIEKSKRYISLEQVKELFTKFEFNKKVLVVQNMPIDELKKVLAEVNFDIVQLHGNEDNNYINQIENIEVWKAVHLKDINDITKALELNAKMFIADAENGGSGTVCNWDLVKLLAQKREVLVAGGININNVQEALKVTGASGVDISSGIELDYGIKSKEKLIKIMEKIKL